MAFRNKVLLLIALVVSGCAWQPMGMPMHDYPAEVSYPSTQQTQPWDGYGYRPDERVIIQEYHFERGGGGVYHQGGCYSLRGRYFDNRGYPALIPPGAKTGNCS